MSSILLLRYSSIVVLLSIVVVPIATLIPAMKFEIQENSVTNFDPSLDFISLLRLEFDTISVFLNPGKYQNLFKNRDSSTNSKECSWIHFKGNCSYPYTDTDGQLCYYLGASTFLCSMPQDCTLLTAATTSITKQKNCSIYPSARPRLFTCSDDKTKSEGENEISIDNIDCPIGRPGSTWDIIHRFDHDLILSSLIYKYRQWNYMYNMQEDWIFIKFESLTESFNSTVNIYPYPYRASVSLASRPSAKSISLFASNTKNESQSENASESELESERESEGERDAKANGDANEATYSSTDTYVSEDQYLSQQYSSFISIIVTAICGIFLFDTYCCLCDRNEYGTVYLGEGGENE